MSSDQITENSHGFTLPTDHDGISHHS